MPVHKPGASGRERIPKQGCEHVPSRYRSSWKLCKPSCASPHHCLLRLFPSIESTEKQMHDWPRVGKPALPPDDIPSNQGQSPVRYRSVLGKQVHLAELETVVSKGASRAYNSGATVNNDRCGEPSAPCFDLTDVLSRSYRSREVAATINNSDEQVDGMTHRTRGITRHGSSGKENVLEQQEMADKFIAARVEKARGFAHKVSLHGGSPGTQGRTLSLSGSYSLAKVFLTT
jgi:hypothetical protein